MHLPTDTIYLWGETYETLNNGLCLLPVHPGSWTTGYRWSWQCELLSLEAAGRDCVLFLRPVFVAAVPVSDPRAGTQHTAWLQDACASFDFNIPLVVLPRGSLLCR